MNKRKLNKINFLKDWGSYTSLVLLALGCILLIFSVMLMLGKIFGFTFISVLTTIITIIIITGMKSYFKNLEEAKYET